MQLFERCVAPFPLNGWLSEQSTVLQPRCFRGPSALITGSLISSMQLYEDRKHVVECEIGLTVTACTRMSRNVFVLALTDLG